MRQWCMLLVIAVGVGGTGTCDEKTGPARAPGLDALLDAIATAESRNGSQMSGDGGRALGPYQIHRDYWRDGTRILGVHWPYREARDPAKARAVVRAYLLHYGKGKSLLELARIHNGGPEGDRKASTLRYARKIEKILAAQARTS
jgi:hypothetical protein